MAWERTAFSQIIAGAAIGRVALADRGSNGPMLLAAGAGMIAVLAGAGMLLWAGVRYTDLDVADFGEAEPPVHPRAAALVGLMAVVLSGLSLVLAAVDLLDPAL